MKLKLLLTIFLTLYLFSAFAQNTYSVKAEVADTALHIKMINASILVLNAKDSILKKFARTAVDGTFSISNLKNGKYILLINYPGYADYVDRFTLDSIHTNIDFGKISLILKSRLLADVIVKASHVAIKIKGDTTEFNAKAFVIQPNDKVEDLLRQLPGIEVDKDGKITAQGQTVNKVLVDGEEFFGDDPTLVTKNLRADMVDKVQLYDKKSDQATFTGIDDGVKTKTINIKLKEDKKNGLFGKVDANIGTDGYYEGQVIFNKFRANQKLAVYGTAANDGRTGLGFQDSNSLGAGNGEISFVDGGISYNFAGNNDALDSFSGYYDGKGVPVARSGGLHYDVKWNDEKETLNANYKIGSIDLAGNTNTTTQQALQTGINLTTSSQRFDNQAFRQKLDFSYLVKLDTTSTLKFTVDGTDKTFHVDNSYLSQTDDVAGIMLNNNNRHVINDGTQHIFNASALYTKKFKKTGRTLSWNLSEAYNQSETNGYLNSKTEFNTTHVPPDSLINEYKTTNTLGSVLNSNITWSEPLFKRVSILLNYGTALNNSSSDRQSYDQSASGMYDMFNQTYSNNYKFNQFTNQIGLIFNYKNPKATFNFGTKASNVNFKQINEYSGDVLKRNFINWTPQAFYQYKFSQQKVISINYNGNTTQPTIDQIQPVLVNSDPLNVTLGNPDLKPSFNNRLTLFYNNYQVISGQQFFINGNISNTINAIVNNTTTSTTGQNTIQYVNLSNKTPFNYYFYTSFSRKVKPFDVSVGLNLSTNGNESYSYINNALDQAKSFTYSGGLSFSKYVQKKYDFFVNGGPSYTFSTLSLQPASNNNAAGFRSSGRFDLYLPLNFGLGSDVRYTYNAKTQTFDAEYLTIWNAYVYKTFLKDEKLKISLSVNDLLDQNTNFSRSVLGNTSMQTTTSGIRRFFMLSLTWDFTKFGTIPAKN